MSRKIAPALLSVLERPFPGFADPAEVEQARREIRAILAVVRGAEKVRRYVQESGYGGLEGPEDKAMFRALARLSRLSAPKPRRGTR